MCIAVCIATAFSAVEGWRVISALRAIRPRIDVKRRNHVPQGDFAGLIPKMPEPLRFILESSTALCEQVCIHRSNTSLYDLSGKASDKRLAGKD